MYSNKDKNGWNSSNDKDDVFTEISENLAPQRSYNRLGGQNKRATEDSADSSGRGQTQRSEVTESQGRATHETIVPRVTQQAYTKPEFPPPTLSKPQNAVDPRQKTNGLLDQSHRPAADGSAEKVKFKQYFYYLNSYILYSFYFISFCLHFYWLNFPLEFNFYL